MPAPTAQQDPTSLERDLLTQLTLRWDRRVAVKRDELDLDGHFDPDLPDFPARLVPVFGPRGAEGLDAEARGLILAAAWVSYNEKTTAMEDEVILPACRLLLREHLPVRRDEAAMTALRQTIVDEDYHILMCHNAAAVTRRRRGLAGMRFPVGGWAVIRGLRECRAGLTGPRRDLVDIAFALAAETTISGFLSTLAGARDIQPMNRMSTELHRRDESAHAVVFRELAGSLYRELAGEERELFKDALVRGVTSFRAPDFDPWVTVAAAGGLEVTAAELAEAAGARPAPPRDFAPLKLLLADLGLTGELAPALGIAA